MNFASNIRRQFGRKFLDIPNPKIIQLETYQNVLPLETSYSTIAHSSNYVRRKTIPTFSNLRPNVGTRPTLINNWHNISPPHLYLERTTLTQRSLGLEQNLQLIFIKSAWFLVLAFRRPKPPSLLRVQISFHFFQ